MFLFPVVAFPQWRWQNPLPCGNSLSSVYFTDNNTGYAVGFTGTILKTIDGGATWTIYSSGPTNWLAQFILRMPVPDLWLVIMDQVD